MSNWRPVVLVILDGWGISERTEGNAIYQAHTPNMDKWQRDHPKGRLSASGKDVGLPAGLMGNSEVGHLNLGAGRIVYQELPRINRSIASGEFFSNSAFVQAMQTAAERGTSLHLIGLVGPGGVHSHTHHLYALLDMAARLGLRKVYVHAILDGRDTPPASALGYIKELEQCIQDEGVGRIATVSGRYYAMDRDKRWDRTQRYYETLLHGEGERAPSAPAAIQRSYENEITDEFVLPAVITQNGEPTATVQDGDVMIAFNFRADRMRQIIKALVLPDFEDFARRRVVNDLYLVTFSNYEDDLPVPVAFPQHIVQEPIAELLSKRDKRQFHTAETEKYAHVTYFFNGGREEPFPGEERALVPSPPVATYDLQPEMSALEVTAQLEQRLRQRTDDFVIVNYANCDMVGHTGIIPAAIKAAETVDLCVGRIFAVVSEVGGLMVVTADHGNAEQMIDYETGQPHTAHTTNPVPFILLNKEFRIRETGRLADVTPTLLEIMGIPQPDCMTGRSMIEP